MYNTSKGIAPFSIVTDRLQEPPKPRQAVDPLSLAPGRQNLTSSISPVISFFLEQATLHSPPTRGSQRETRKKEKKKKKKKSTKNRQRVGVSAESPFLPLSLSLSLLAQALFFSNSALDRPTGGEW